MARGDHELPKVSLGPAMPDPTMPYGRPEDVLHPLGHPMPYASDQELIKINSLIKTSWSTLFLIKTFP
jgi:hypothetical protein